MIRDIHKLYNLKSCLDSCIDNEVRLYSIKKEASFIYALFPKRKFRSIPQPSKWSPFKIQFYN